jgi:molecular chaperone DnaK
VSQEVGGALYAQQAEAAGAAGGEAPGEGAQAGGATSSDDDVVDAEIVDDEGTEKR